MYLCFFCNSFVYFPNYNRWQLVFLNAIFSCFFFLFFHKCIQFYFWLWYAALNLTSLFCLYVKIFRSDEIDIYTVHRYLYIDRCISVSLYLSIHIHTHTRAQLDHSWKPSTHHQTWPSRRNLVWDKSCLSSTEQVVGTVKTRQMCPKRSRHGREHDF